MCGDSLKTINFLTIKKRSDNACKEDKSQACSEQNQSCSCEEDESTTQA
jgi:hypothetical protein